MAKTAAAPKFGLAVPFRANTPLRKKIGWHIAQGFVHAVVLTITPEDARELLDQRNTKNRPISRPALTRYTKAMTDGWVLTGETLIFGKSGELLNGQHRLQACINAGRAFDVLVCFGIDDASFKKLDRPKLRDASDIFYIEGEVQTKRMAAAAKWLWRYDTGHAYRSGHQDLEPDELLAYYRKNYPGLPESLIVAGWFQAKESRLAPPSLMMALHHLCAQKDSEMAITFFRRVATGIDIKSSRTPEGRLRNRLLETKMGGALMNDGTIAAITIKAWNAMRTKARISPLEFRQKDPEEAFPVII